MEMIMAFILGGLVALVVFKRPVTLKPVFPAPKEANLDILAYALAFQCSATRLHDTCRFIPGVSPEEIMKMSQLNAVKCTHMYRKVAEEIYSDIHNPEKAKEYGLS